MPETHLLVDIGSIIDHEGEGFRRRENFEILGTDLDRPRSQVRVLGSLGTRPNSPADPHAVFHLEVGDTPVFRRIGDDLDEPTGISDIEESDATMVTPALHPPGNRHLAADVGLAKRPGAVRSHPCLPLNQSETSSSGRSARSSSV